MYLLHMFTEYITFSEFAKQNKLEVISTEKLSLISQVLKSTGLHTVGRLLIPRGTVVSDNGHSYSILFFDLL